jgi:hypothetical protein
MQDNRGAREQSAKARLAVSASNHGEGKAVLRVLLLSGLIATSVVLVATAAPQTPNSGPSGPFSKLFRGDLKPSSPAPLIASQPPARGDKQKSKTVCGTLILVPEPVDPRMVKRPKGDVTYTMRLVPPPACSSK